jgi:hypothetical protein
MEAYMADKYFDNEKSCINLENDCNTDTISILMKENLLICHKIRKVSSQVPHLVTVTEKSEL